MFEAIMQIPSLVQTRADIPNEIRMLQSDPQAIEQKVTDLAAKVESAESCAFSVLPLKDAVEMITTRVGTVISSLAALYDSQDDFDNLS